MRLPVVKWQQVIQAIQAERSQHSLWNRFIRWLTDDRRGNRDESIQRLIDLVRRGRDQQRAQLSWRKWIFKLPKLPVSKVFDDQARLSKEQTLKLVTHVSNNCVKHDSKDYLGGLRQQFGERLLSAFKNSQTRAMVIVCYRHGLDDAYSDRIGELAYSANGEAIESLHSMFQTLNETSDLSEHRALTLAILLQGGANSNDRIIQGLNSQLSLNERKAAVQAGDYAAIRWAAKNGHTGTIQYLETHLTPAEQKAAVQARNYAAIRIAAKNGYTETIQHLESHLSASEQKMAVQANDYEAIRQVPSNGHTGTIQYLLSCLPPDEQKAAVQANNYEAIRAAAYNGHTGIIQHLLSHLTTDEQKVAVKANNYEVIRNAAQYGHIETVNYLLTIDVNLAYAEAHDYEYGRRYVYPFVTQTLASLRQRQTDFQAQNPNVTFDLATNEEARLCFYLLRNAIRRGVDRDHACAEATGDDIRFLLTIPSVRDLCHQALYPSVRNLCFRALNEVGYENELLRLARRIGNQQACEQLLQLPDVYRLAFQNNFYQADDQGNWDLNRLARDRESAMTALSQDEQQALQRVQTQYTPEMERLGGPAQVINQLKTDLQARYEQNPATITVHDSPKGAYELQLPLTWSEFQKLKLTQTQYQNALQAYYQHQAHTVWRLLSKPNPWIDYRANFVQYDSQNRPFAAFEGYQKTIALLYLAARDNQDYPPIEGFTLDERKKNFFEELRLLNRAHNYDQQRPVIRNKEYQYDANGDIKTEECDDLQGDKPSCYSGFKSRLFQSVLGHGLLQNVTRPIVRQALNEHIRAYFEKAITTENCQDLQDAYDGIAELEGDFEQHKKVLQTIDLSDQEKEDIIKRVCDQLQGQYQAQFNADNWTEYMRRELERAPMQLCDLFHFDERANLRQLLQQKVAEKDENQRAAPNNPADGTSHSQSPSIVKHSNTFWQNQANANNNTQDPNNEQSFDLAFHGP